MIRLGMSGSMDAAILFSSDNDLMPAIEVLWHHLNESGFRAVRNTYDYSIHE